MGSGVLFCKNPAGTGVDTQRITRHICTPHITLHPLPANCFLPTKSPPSQARQQYQHIDLVSIDGSDNRFYVYSKIPLAHVLMQSVSLGTSARHASRHMHCERAVFAHKKPAIAYTTAGIMNA
jgi:hypothetical protein